MERCFYGRPVELGGDLSVRLGLSYRLLLDESADVSDRLAKALLILDQGDSHIMLAVLAEGPARSNGDLGMVHKVHRKIDASSSL